MKKYLESYHVFLPGRKVRWGVYLAYPAALLLVFAGVWAVLSPMTAGLALPVFFMGIENGLDMFVFGGIAGRGNARQMEYIRASSRGMEVADRAFVFDRMRRLLYLAAVGVCVLLADRAEAGGWPEGFIFWLAVCDVSVAGLCTSLLLWPIRLSDNRSVQYMTAFLAPYLAAALLFSILSVSGPVLFVFCLAGGAVSAAGQICFLKKRMREGYYDK